VITWYSGGSQDGSGWGVYGQAYHANGTAYGGEFRVNSSTGGHQSHPSVSALQDGTFIITFHGPDGSDYGIYGRRFNPDGTPYNNQNDFSINTYNNSAQTFTDVTVLENGNYVVTWYSNGQDGSGWGVYGRVFNSNGAPINDEEFRVNSITNGHQSNPAVSALKDGSFIITFHGPDGSDYGVYARRYNADGIPYNNENEFLINDHISSAQTFSDITALENGGFVVTWGANGQDGSSWGVYQKVYSPQNNGADGNDILRGGDGNDTLYGHAGDDLLVGGEGADYINGGDGIDTVSYFESDSAVNVNLATGVESGGHAQGDTIADVENVIGSDYDDVITGNSSANTLEGGYGNDNISGGDGNDIILGGAGADIINGGSGWDTVSYADSVSGVEIDIAAGTGKYGHADGDTLNSIEYFIGSDYDDRFVLSNNNSNFAAGLGEDTVVLQGASTEYEVTYDNGQISAKHIASGTIYSFADVEKFAFDDAEYSAKDFEGSGDSVAKFIEGNTVSGIILDNVGNDTISVESNGSNGTVTINGGNYTYVPNSSTFTGTDQFTIKIVDGDNGSIHMQKVDVEISTNSSTDTTLEGTSGNDVLQSGDGNDVLTGYAGSDILDGGAGIDTADYSTSFGGVNVNLETGVGTDNAAEGDELTNIENITGSAFDDTLTGESNDNVLIGADGSDILTGGLGNDDLQGGDGLDKALYVGNSSEYNITLDNGQIEVIDNELSNGDEGTDTLTEIEQLEFANNQFTLADFSQTEGGVLNVLTDNDSLFVAGIDSDTFTVDIAPAKGGIVFNADGTASYQPNASETGADSFSYVITNALGLSKVVNVIVDISGTPVNTSSTGNDTLFGTATDDVLDAGDGSDVIATGTGNDTVVIRLDAKSKDIITDFDVASDKVDLTDFDFMFDSFAELMLQTSDDGTDATIDFGNGQTVVLKGVTKAQLTKDNFVGNVTLNALPVAALTALTVDIDEVTNIDVLAEATDLDGDVITLDSVGTTANPNASVAIVNGEIVYTPETGFTGLDSFEYTISDNQGGVVTQTLNITVEEVNDAPTGITLSNSTLVENIDGAVIGDLTVADVDTDDSHTFTVDDARFEVVNGQLKLVDGQSLDFETEPTVDVNITATDLAGESTAPITFALTVTDANDAPTGITLSNNALAENADGAIIGNLTVADVDAGDSHTFTVDDARFEIVNNQLKLVDGQSLDYETEQSININIIATDSSGISTSQIPFALDVTDVAEVVYGTNSAETITGYGGGIGQDIIYAFGGNDLIGTYAGDDYIEAGAGNDDVYGGDGNDIIEGQVGHDVLFGGAGNDTIRGGYGVDHMQGDAGIDTFVFSILNDSNATYGVDTIYNFEDGTDLIDLSTLDASGISSFSDLTVADDGSVTTITGNSNNFELKLNGIYTIDENDFVF
jgi:Ca2+-binding RTX toxin-like protein